MDFSKIVRNILVSFLLLIFFNSCNDNSTNTNKFDTKLEDNVSVCLIPINIHAYILIDPFTQEPVEHALCEIYDPYLKFIGDTCTDVNGNATGYIECDSNVGGYRVIVKVFEGEIIIALGIASFYYEGNHGQTYYLDIPVNPISGFDK